jgi:cobalt transporter subunit CbtA
MFKTIVFSAFGAGLAVCLAVSALQFATTEALILQAEAFEGAPAPDAAAAPGSDAAVHEHEDEDEEWGPANGIERTAYTVLANLVVGFAVSLMLLGGMAIKGDPIDARRGLFWGVAGFAAVSLLPGLGLPPELPGTPAADITDRQIWWLGAAVASAAGIGLLAFSRNWGLLAAGVALLIAPHVVGAPAPPSHAVSYPGALAGEFVVASMVVSAVLWSLSGLAAGWLHQRLSQGG